jgi:hypothetical protein
VIIGCLEHIPAGVAPAAGPVAEQVLLEAAEHEHPGALARTAALLLARLDPDGREPRDEELERRRGFTLTKRPDGSARPSGSWTPELTAAWDAILDSLAAPVPAADGVADERSPAQRRHDAMAEAAMRLLRSDTLPAAGGVPISILAVTTVTELFPRTGTGAATSTITGADARAAAGAGLAMTGHGELISLERLLRCAGDAEIVPVVLDQAGGVLAYGRGRRLASRGQRLALAARDGGCSFPDCDRPAAWTEVHHVIQWNRDGPTDLDNMCLVCRYHHREFERRGWQVQMTRGRPEWIPPPWIDPEQRPRTNTVHHRELVFDASDLAIGA